MYSRRQAVEILGLEMMGKLVADALNAPPWQEPPGMVWYDVQQGEIPPEASTRGQWCSQCGRKFRGGPEDAIGWQWARNPNPPTFNFYVVRCACCNPGYDCPDCAAREKAEEEERKLEEEERKRAEEERKRERKKKPKRTKKRQTRGSKRSAQSITTNEHDAAAPPATEANTKKPRRSARIKAAASKATKGK